MIGSIVSTAFKLFPGAQFTFDGARLLGKFPRGGARLDLTLSPEEAEAMAQTALDLAATLRRSLRTPAEPAPASSPVSSPVSGPATAQRELVNVAASLPAPRPAVSLPAEVPKRGRPPAPKA
jgi:hypothetical protein